MQNPSNVLGLLFNQIRTYAFSILALNVEQV